MKLDQSLTFLRAFYFLLAVIVVGLLIYDFVHFVENTELDTKVNKTQIILLQQKVKRLKIKVQQNDDTILNLQFQTHLLTETINEVSIITVKASSYNAVKEQTDSDPNITACLVQPTVGSVAVSQDLYFKGWTCGKKVHIKSKGIFIIKDVMHYRKTEQIDILTETKEQANQFGIVKNLNAVLLSHYSRL